ncbi:hypothetical protein V2J09_003679 [Rumex salicifolius]
MSLSPWISSNLLSWYLLLATELAFLELSSSIFPLKYLSALKMSISASPTLFRLGGKEESYSWLSLELGVV